MTEFRWLSLAAASKVKWNSAQLPERYMGYKLWAVESINRESDDLGVVQSIDLLFEPLWCYPSKHFLLHHKHWPVCVCALTPLWVECASVQSYGISVFHDHLWPLPNGPQIRVGRIDGASISRMSSVQGSPIPVQLFGYFPLAHYVPYSIKIMNGQGQM